MAMDGAEVVLLVNTGSESSPNYQPVAEQTGLTHENSRNMIDATSKDNDHEKFLYGKQNGTISLESLYVPNDAAAQALKNAEKNAEKIIVLREEEGSQIEKATCLVESFEDDWPDNDSSTTSIELQKNEDFTSV